MARKNSKTATLEIEHYTHGAKRKNNPPATLAGEGTVPQVEKAKYAYSPHLDPVLRFDSTGKSDVIEDLLAKAKERALSSDELEILRKATSQHQPWLEWTGKQEEHDRGLFEVDPVALHIHERVSANAILHAARRKDVQRNLFADPELEYQEEVQFYQHDVDWANRLILGDSLQVMSSLAHRENLAGKVQMIYMDPPYGINFASNFQPLIKQRDVSQKEHDLTREPEMVQAYRDTWKLGLHTYLTYLHDRLRAARELLSNSGSVFIQIGDENVHLVRGIADEVFGRNNFFAEIPFTKTRPLGGAGLVGIYDVLLWYSKNSAEMKFRPVFIQKSVASNPNYSIVEDPNGHRRRMGKIERLSFNDQEASERVLQSEKLASSGFTKTCYYDIDFAGKTYSPKRTSWRTNPDGMSRLIKSNRIYAAGSNIGFVSYFDENPVQALPNIWTDTRGEMNASYVVQTASKVLDRCVLMATDPGDLVLDPTCGSGTTAYTAEKLGRRWITIDTSRVTIAIARQRLLTSDFDYYQLLDESESPGGIPAGSPGNGFRCRHISHVSLSSIARNENLDPIFDLHENILDEKLRLANKSIGLAGKDLREALTAKLADKMQSAGLRAVTDADCRRWLLPGTTKSQIENAFAGKSKLKAAHVKKYFEMVPPDGKFEHWHVPFDTDPDWPESLSKAVTAYREAWRAKMDKVNECIAANAEQKVLVDDPVIVPNVVRVSGPFTVEGVMPAELSLLEEGLFSGGPEALRDDDGNGIPDIIDNSPEMQNTHAYLQRMCKHLERDGVKFLNNQQQHFARLDPLFGDGSGSPIHAEAVWKTEDEDSSDDAATVAVSFGPQYGPVTAMQVEDLIHAARANGYEELVVAGFSFDPEATATMSELTAGKLQVHLAHIRPDINPGMDGLLKDTANSELFTVFGLPDVSIDKDGDNYEVTLEGVAIYDPIKSEVRATKAEKVAAWFLDADYDGRCFCITQAFFPDQNAWDKLANALQYVIDTNAFAAFKGTTSLPFEAGEHKKIAVKVIDPRGNEVMVVKRLGEDH